MEEYDDHEDLNATLAAVTASEDASVCGKSSVEDVETKASSIVNDEVSEIKDLFRDHLDNLRGASDWACWSSLSDEVNPGSTLESSGIVGLPLSARDASRIKQESGLEGPSHNASEDTTGIVCKLSADHFKLRNPAWQKHIQRILAEVMEALSIDSAI